MLIFYFPACLERVERKHYGVPWSTSQSLYDTRLSHVLPLPGNIYALSKPIRGVAFQSGILRPRFACTRRLCFNDFGLRKSHLIPSPTHQHIGLLVYLLLRRTWDLQYRGCDTCMRLIICLLYTSPSPRDQRGSRMPSSA